MGMGQHHDTHATVQEHRNKSADSDGCLAELRNQFTVLREDVQDMEKVVEFYDHGINVLPVSSVSTYDHTIDLDDRLFYNIFVSFHVSRPGASEVLSLHFFTNSNEEPESPVSIDTDQPDIHNFEFVNRQGSQFRLRILGILAFDLGFVSVLATPVITHEPPPLLSEACFAAFTKG